MDCRGKQVLVYYSVLLVVQIVMVIILLVFGARGKSFMDESADAAGIPYYVSAFLVGSVYGLLALSTLLMVILYICDYNEGTGAVVCSLCVFAYLGLPAFLLGMIFTVAFGIANCKKDENTTYDQQGGFCSYTANIDKNYDTAVVCLVIIILLFLTSIIDVFLLCKYDLGTVGDIDSSGIDPFPNNSTSRGGDGGGSSGNHGGNPTLRMMARDRNIRNDENRQRRMGIPENRIVSKFIPRY